MINRAIANKGSALFSHNDDSRLHGALRFIGLSVVAQSFFKCSATRSFVAVLRAPWLSGGFAAIRSPLLLRALRARALLPQGRDTVRCAPAPR